MKFIPSTPTRVSIFIIALILHYSCTKDSDLLSDYVMQDSIEQIANDQNGEDSSQGEEQPPADPPPIDSTNDQDRNYGELKAFPSAVGNGSNAVGGRGKALAIVNTLDWDAPLTYHEADGSVDEYYIGGLSKALQEPSVGYIIFNVSGYINIGDSGTGTTYSGVYRKTVFGQSAPKGGITLTGGGFRLNSFNIDDCDELIFRYLRSRPLLNRFGVFDPSDDDAWTWAFLTEGGDNVVFDHCSGSFASDKIMGSFLSNNKHDGTGITLSNHTWSHNLVADGGTGMVVGTNPGDPWDQMDDVTHYKNLFVSVNRTPNMNLGGEVEHINNVIFDAPSKLGRVFNETKINHIGNYYKRTNNSANEFNTNTISDQNDPKVYSANNVYVGTVGGSFIDYDGTEFDNSGMWENYNSGTTADSKYFIDTKHSAMSAMVSAEDIDTPQDAYNELINARNVGAYKYLNDNGEVSIFRDSFDTAMISHVANNTNYTSKQSANWALPTLPSNTRPSSYDSDNDGMSDVWEIAYFGDLSQSYRGDHNGDGYENIEEYMNQVDFN